VAVHACAIYQTCTIGTGLPGVACCAACPGFLGQDLVPEAGQVRHLIYHVYPRGPVWRWNIEQLRQRMSLFNGSRTIGIAHDALSDPPEAVQEALAGLGIDWIVRPNDPHMREMVTYPHLVAVPSRWAGLGDATFYGHAKGISSEPWAPGVRRWTTAMYLACLDHWPHVQRCLQEYPVAGPFLRRWTGLPGHSVTWHYSGTFRWYRNRDMYSRDWQCIGQNWCGAEGHIPMHFRREEAACLLGEFGSGGLGLYLSETWDSWATEAVRRYEEEHMIDRQTPLICTVVICSHQKPQYVHDAIRSVIMQTCPDWRLVIIDSGDLIRRGEFSRYSLDARILAVASGEELRKPAHASAQAWCHNQILDQGLVAGELVCFLSDDDVYSPDAFGQWIGAARDHPDQHAWYAPAIRTCIRPDGVERHVDILPLRRVTEPARQLDCIVDGMQVCCRTAMCPPWPEGHDVAYHADGVWMDALGQRTPIYPLPLSCGRHRITPVSTFTRELP
jgi:hypothetical protein